ncbi:hypothetical protein [Actinomadura nitritigenes]|uniref:hypothetical protein n=1 Tax=Actinomadura nitritigenes TaxID=134602 RepID=UPI003D8F9CC1
MTDLKLDSKVTAGVGEALGPYINEMWRKQDGRWVGLVEFKHVRREEPGAGEDAPPAVKVRLTHCEIADDDTEPKIRELMQAMYKLRTAQGTLDDEAILEHQVIPERLKWAVDTMLWPPRPGDVWTVGDDGDEPYFAIVGEDGDVKLIDSTGDVHSYDVVFAQHERMDLKARKRVKRGDDSA